MSKQELTLKQRKLIEEFCVDGNAAQAAIRAGYSPNSAKEQAARLLTKDNAKQYLSELREKQIKKTGDMAERVIRELAKIAFSDIRDYSRFNESGVTLKDSDQMDSEKTGVISEVTETVTSAGGTTKIKMYDKTKALELLGKNLGLFSDKHEITGKDGGPIRVSESMSGKERREKLKELLSVIGSLDADDNEVDEE